jgi:putative acetyltransferase
VGLKGSLAVSIREMRPADARAFLEVHHRAVRELAGDDYPLDVIEVWAPLPIIPEHVDFVRSTADREYRLVAELDGEIVGIGCLIPKNNELRACYVAPWATRKGVGSAILRQIERVARDQGATTLHADSSLTAEPFYRVNGYEVCESSEHVLNNGAQMTCVRICKNLAPCDPSTSERRDWNVMPGAWPVLVAKPWAINRTGFSLAAARKPSRPPPPHR